MVIDTSALVAIERKEEDAARFEEAIVQAGGGYLSAVSFVEFSMVTVGRGDGQDALKVDDILHRLNIDVIEVTPQDAFLVRDAFLRYGKGRSPAGLNLGDCFSYALSKRLGEPLLFKGDDFSQTDVLKA